MTEESNTPDWMMDEDASSDAPESTSASEFEAAVNPNRRFRIQSTTVSRDVPCLVGDNGEYLPEPLGDIMTRSQLTFGRDTVFQLDGADVGYGQIVQPGALIIAIGNVKGA